MTITKNTKIIVGVALLGVAGYIYWQSKQEKKEAAVNCKAGETNKDGKCVADATPPTCVAPKVLNTDKTACVDAPTA